MLYCENCMKPVEAGRCPDCNRKKLRELKPDDPVYLITKDATIGASIEDILRQNNIPCLKRAELGAGITAYVGYYHETFRFYVPHSLFEHAKELLANFFDANEDQDEKAGTNAP